MELLHLKYFKRVAENLNYTKTANELNVSQPALSMMIKKLEQELNVELFYKKGRNVFLTDNGSILLKSANNIFNELNKAEELIYRNEQTQNKTISFASSHSRLISYIFDEYIKHNPQYMYNCEIDTMGAIIQKIINYDIQFALSSIPINHPRIECQPIIDEDIVITYPKQFDNSPNFDFIYNNDIIKNFVFPAHNQDYNNLTKSKLITMNLNIHHSTYVDDAFITSIVKQRQNFAFVPVSMCRKLELPYIPHSDLISHTSIYLSSLKNEKLNEVNLDMFKFIESYLKKNKAFYVINRNS